MSIDFKQLEKLIRLAKKHRLQELEVEQAKLKVSFKTQYYSKNTVISGGGYAPSVPSQEPSLSTNKQMPLEREAHALEVCSPFVGTFYRAPSPSASPYVKEGDSIKKGDVLCIIEAMKLMNEIEADVSGKLVSVLVNDGEPVEFGEPIFIIEPIG